MLQGPAGGLLSVQEMNQIEDFENKTMAQGAMCSSQRRRRWQCVMIAVLSYPCLSPLSKRLVEILWWARSGGSGTPSGIMKQEDPV